MSELDDALTAWRAALGEASVITGAAERAAAEAATFATAQRIPAILRPGSREEVQACLRIASAHRVPVYPVSAGKNWGYGSRVPWRDGSVLIELRRLDRIVAHDEALGTLTVQPGVTFQQAHDFLRDRGSRLFVATTGGSPQASLIGNALERGDGVGPHGDVFRHVCGLEVVLASGECLHTGHARFAGARTARAFRWGVGPALDGLFSQSNLGVVTEMTFFLARRAAYRRQFLGGVEREEEVGPLVDALRELALEGTLDGTFYVWNDLKVLSTRQRYPFAAVGGRTPLPEWVLAEFREGWPGGRWSVTGDALGATAEIGAAREQRIEALLRPVTRTLIFSDEQGTAPQGVPTEQNLAMTYWRKQAMPPPGDVDPDRDRCGFLWVSCAIPAEGAAVTDALRIAGSATTLFGFEPNLSLMGISARCLYLVAAIAFDRDTPGEDDRALACHHALSRELGAAGFYPARLGLASVDPRAPRLRSADDTDRALRAIKAALDPEGILAPGRYEP